MQYIIPIPLEVYYGNMKKNTIKTKEVTDNFSNANKKKNFQEHLDICLHKNKK